MVNKAVNNSIFSRKRRKKVFIYKIQTLGKKQYHEPMNYYNLIIITFKHDIAQTSKCIFLKTNECPHWYSKDCLL